MASSTPKTLDKLAVHQMFGKKDLGELGLGWAKGGEANPWKSKRNTKGGGTFSVMLGKAIVVAMCGNINELITNPSASAVQVTSESTADATQRVSYYVEPDGGWDDPEGPVIGLDPYDGHVNYHIGLAFLGLAMARPEQAKDLLNAYLALLKTYLSVGCKWEEILKDKLYHATDELYFWMKLQSEPPSSSVDLLKRYQLTNSAASPLRVDPDDISIDPKVFTDPAKLERLIMGKAPVSAPVTSTAGKTGAASAAPAHAGAESTTPSRRRKTPANPFVPVVDPDPAEPEADEFVGPQLDLIKESIATHRNSLLIGPTGTGKTRAVEEAVMDSGLHLLVRIKGMAGLQDLDFLGGFLPLPGGGHKWKDGPLAQAVRLASENPVVLFVDEITRIPQEQLNILVAFMTATPADVMRAEGLAVEGNGDYFVLQIPMLNETIWCPKEHLVVIGAGNLGMEYAVSQRFDPALRRRFQTMIEFSYLRGEQLKALVIRRVPDLPGKVLETIVAISDHILDMVATQSLRTAMDTASLIEWAAKAKLNHAQTLSDLIDQAYLTWADQVCGRNALGMVEIGAFHGIFDFERKKKDRLPEGKTIYTPNRI